MTARSVRQAGLSLALPMLRYPVRVPRSPQDTGPKRAMAVRCVKGEGPFVFGDRYYAVKGHAAAGEVIYLDVMLEQYEQRTAEASLFVPENPAHWPLFPLAHRLRFAPDSFGRRAA